MSNHILNVKNAIIKDIKLAKKTVDAISIIESPKTIMSSPKINQEKTSYDLENISIIEDKTRKINNIEKTRRKALPKKIKNNVHSVYDIDLYLAYKKAFIKKLPKECYIIKSQNKNGIFSEVIVDELRYVNAMEEIKQFDYMYTFIVNLLILFCMIHTEPDSFFNNKIDTLYQENMNNKHDVQKWPIKKFLECLMLSNNLYYVQDIYDNMYHINVLRDLKEMCVPKEYIDWLYENQHLSFEEKYNKGIEFFYDMNKYKKMNVMEIIDSSLKKKSLVKKIFKNCSIVLFCIIIVFSMIGSISKRSSVIIPDIMLNNYMHKQQYISYCNQNNNCVNKIGVKTATEITWDYNIKYKYVLYILNTNNEYEKSGNCVLVIDKRNKGYCILSDKEIKK